MTDFEQEKPAEYVAERIQRAIVSELGDRGSHVAVRLVEGRVFLSGSAATRGDREVIGWVAHREALPDFAIVNNVELRGRTEGL